jgi:hypothetical protein
MTDADRIPNLYQLHVMQLQLSSEIAAVKESARLQQKTLDEISSNSKWLNRLVLGAMVLAVVRFAMTGGFNV